MGERPIKALLDPYNPTGSTRHVRFNTSQHDRWADRARSAATSTGWCCDSDWEAEFCRVAEAHPRVRPTSRTTTSASKCPIATARRSAAICPDFIVLVDDGHGATTCCNLVVEIKGYRREDAKEKKSTMETYWVPGVNNLGGYGRWAFAEFTDVYADRSRLRGEGRQASSTR